MVKKPALNGMWEQRKPALNGMWAQRKPALVRKLVLFLRIHTSFTSII